MLEALFCPCCTPAIVHALAQSELLRIPQPMLWLGTGAIATAIRPQPPSSVGGTGSSDANSGLIPPAGQPLPASLAHAITVIGGDTGSITGGR